MFALVWPGGAGDNCAMSSNLKNFGIVSVLTVASRVLGLARDILITAVFGTTAWASAFVMAFTLPNLFRRFLGEGALTAALVPTLSEELETGSRERAFRLVNQVSSWVGLATGVIVVVAMAGLAGVAGSNVLDSWTEVAEKAQRWRQAAGLAVVLFPYLIFICLSAALSAALQTLGKFAAPALSPVWLNLAIIAFLGGATYATGIADDAVRMNWLCAGVLVGGLCQLLGPALALWREGWRPRVDFTASPAVRRMLWLMGPTVLGSAVYLINMAVSRFIGLSLNESAVAVLNLATRLIELPIGVFAISVTTVVFPLISSFAARQDWAGMGAAYRKGMRLVLAINVPAAVGLMVLATPIVRVLFQRGAFSAEDTGLTVPVLMVFAAGLPVLAFVNLMLRAFYAEKDTRTPVRGALLSFWVNVGLSLLLMGPLSTLGLAIASNVAVVLQAYYLQHQLSHHRPELRFGAILPDVAKIVLATAGMAAVVFSGYRFSFSWGSGWGADLIRLAGLIPLGGLTYGALVWGLRLEGREELLAILRRSRERRKA